MLCTIKNGLALILKLFTSSIFVVFAGLLILMTIVQAQAQDPPPKSCASDKPQHWHKYVNKSYGFSFWYPDPYRRVSLPPPDSADEFRAKVNHEKRLLLLERRDDPDAKIWVSTEVRPFDLEALTQSHAPTGVEFPPAPRQFGTHVFYGYGAGGGGVDYPDQYFVNLKEKILHFDFDGPYEYKSPNGETRDLEPRILKTFRIRSSP
jgi:hypothetical protein